VSNHSISGQLAVLGVNLFIGDSNMRDPKAGLTFGYSPPYRKGFTTKQ
jgi:hypothetical protein